MLKWQKKQAIETLHTLRETHDEIHRLSFGSNWDIIVGLLSEIQECAASLCVFLSLPSLDSVIDAYYRELYETSLLEADEIPQAVNRLNACLNRINYAINAEPAKIEVVFFPYKADMWDSLESIWLAAKEDKNCEVFVVPIPYYNVSDGSGGNMTLHCEADSFPSSVQVLDWRTYNFENRRPDIAYIHNPYDDFNHVIKTDERFCSLNLKKFVKLLVLSPYSVIHKSMGESFCIKPGIFNSDIVVVQSEEIRDSYLKNIRHAHKKQGEHYKKKYWERKIVALGSPKFDKVINAKRENFMIPDSWKKVIFKADGTRRKVVLYNTTLSELLNNSLDEDGNSTDLFLKKIKWVINIFKNCDDCVLLWRPHPFLAQTIASMRPQLYSSYRRIAEEYERDAFGIYDKSSELHRAIALSDALYGGWSSLNILYWAVKKPALMANNKYIPDYAKWARFVYEFDVAVHYNGDWYVLMRYFPSLYRIDRTTRKAEFLGTVPCDKNPQVRLFIDGVVFEGKLYLAPISYSKIVCYDFESNKFTSIDIDLKRTHKYSAFDNCYFSRVIEHRGYLYFVPVCYPAFVRLDPKQGVLEYFDDWTAEFLQSFDLTKIWRIARDAVLVGDKIYACCQSRDMIIVFDTANCKVQIIEMNTGFPGFGFIVHDGENFWLSPIKGNSIIKWNGRDPADIFSPSVIDNRRGYYYGALTCEYGKVLYYPRVGNVMAVVDIKTNQIDEFQCDTEVSWGNKLFTPSVNVQGDSKIMFNNETGELILQDGETAPPIVIDPVTCFQEKQSELVKRRFDWGEGEEALIKRLETYTGRVMEGANRSDLIELLFLLSATNAELNLSGTLPEEHKVSDIDANLFQATSGKAIHDLAKTRLERLI